jgi:ATP-dependent RNA helicase HelY
LSRIYCESDLLVAECLRQGVWKGLGPAELAAVASAVIFESRREGDTVESGGPGALRHALDETVRVWRELRADEIRHKLPPTREPDFGFAAAIYHWASDNSLVEALIAAGDQGRALSAGSCGRGDPSGRRRRGCCVTRRRVVGFARRPKARIRWWGVTVGTKLDT